MGGLAWLFLGVPYSNSLLYVDEHDEYLKKFPDNFRADYAVSREQKNADGQKMYIQTKMAEYAHLHVRLEGHGVRHGGVLLASREEGRRRMEGLREGDEERTPLPCRGLLMQQFELGQNAWPVHEFSHSARHQGHHWLIDGVDMAQVY